MTLADTPPQCYILCCSSVVALECYRQEQSKGIALNLGANSLTVSAYCVQNQLKKVPLGLASASDAPQQLLAAVLHGVEGRQNCYIGLAGVSYESALVIIRSTEARVQNAAVFFVSYTGEVQPTVAIPTGTLSDAAVVELLKGGK